MAQSMTPTTPGSESSTWNFLPDYEDLDISNQRDELDTKALEAMPDHHQHRKTGPLRQSSWKTVADCGIDIFCIRHNSGVWDVALNEDTRRPDNELKEMEFSDSIPWLSHCAVCAVAQIVDELRLTWDDFLSVLTQVGELDGEQKKRLGRALGLLEGWLEKGWIEINDLTMEKIERCVFNTTFLENRRRIFTLWRISKGNPLSRLVASAHYSLLAFDFSNVEVEGIRTKSLAFIHDFQDA